MQIIRTWPQKPPDNHPRIYDNCTRTYIKTNNYSIRDAIPNP